MHMTRWTKTATKLVQLMQLVRRQKRLVCTQQLVGAQHAASQSLLGFSSPTTGMPAGMFSGPGLSGVIKGCRMVSTGSTPVRIMDE